MAEQNRRDIYILVGFNNYFNRTIKYYNELIDYLGTISTYTNATNINFKPNDDVSTEIILNVSKEYSHADYLIVMNGNDIESRWFIQHEHRTRNGQYQFTLRRDVIADNLQALQTSPIFVERAWLRDDNPLIYADEGMTLNQIKSNETLLKDKTGIGWIVGYLVNETLQPFEGQGDDKYAFSQRTGAIVPDNIISLSSLADKIGLTENQLISIININGDQSVRVDRVNGDFTFKAWVKVQNGTDWELLATYWTNQSLDYAPYNLACHDYRFSGNIDDYKIGTWDGDILYYYNSVYYNLQNIFKESLRDRINQYRVALKNDLFNILGRIVLTSNQYNILRNLSNTYNYVSYNGIVYKLDVKPYGTLSRKSYHYSNDNQTISNIMSGVNHDLTVFSSAFYHPATTPPLKIEYEASQIGIILTPTAVNSYRVHLHDKRNRPSDCAYSMFAIPCGPIRYAEDYSSTVYDNQSQSVSGSSTQPTDFQISFPKQQGYTIVDQTIGGSDITINFTSDFAPEPAYSDITLTETADYWVFTGKVVGINYRLTINVRFTGQSSGQSPNIKVTGLSLDDSISLAISIAKKLGGSKNELYLYDLQLLPYCPCLDMINDYYNAIITYDNSVVENDDYDWIELQTSEDVWERQGLVLYPRSCNIRTTIDYSLGLKTSKKVDSNCDMYRILSPNGSGGFDFNVAKNGGSVDYFVVDCTYKPYTPYIRIAPQFKELYGANYHDMRGLVCGGDFSLPIMNDPWTNYQLQNKNYANIFDRDIQNLDFRQSREQRMQEITMPLKILSSGIQGGVQGFQATGSPYGAIAGAGIGVTAGAVGSGVDLAMATELRGENRRYAIDKFNFTMGNIKALPTSMSRNTSYTINNKIFPYLEYYTCTEEEREAFERKIEWDSMSVMKIGYLAEYQIPNEPHYFKGRLIRGIDVIGDQHILQEINDELEKGVYI